MTKLEREVKELVEKDFDHMFYQYRLSKTALIFLRRLIEKLVHERELSIMKKIERIMK